MQKIKLPNTGDMPTGEGTIAGWGAMDSDVGASQSRYLMTVSGPITSLEGIFLKEKIAKANLKFNFNYF